MAAASALAASRQGLGGSARSTGRDAAWSEGYALRRGVQAIGPHAPSHNILSTDYQA
jgi:hypothetical protein